MDIDILFFCIGIHKYSIFKLFNLNNAFIRYL